MRILLSILIGILSLSFPSDLFAKKQEKLNVVLMVVDALRADHLGCYGYHRSTSPNMDKLSKKGVLFSQAFSQGTCTGISMPSVFTSLYPRVHRVHRVAAGGVRLPDKFITLPEILSNNGYITAGFMGLLEGLFNFDRRFQLYDIISPKAELSRIVPQINKKAYDWLEKNRTQPFFLYLHYPGLHDPYLLPAPYNTIFWQKGITDEIKNFIKSFSRNEQGKQPPPLKQELLDFVISQYDGAIRYVDAYIGDFLEELERLGLSKNTLVILIADHGEEFFEHGNFFHGHSLYDELIHVPLIMQLPEALPQGKVIPNLVRLIDIMPSILDILNIHTDNIMQGASLLPLIKGEDMPELESFSEAHLRPLRGIRTDKWAFIGTYDSEDNLKSFELYNLEGDKQQTDNLAAKRPEEARLFTRKLEDYIIGGNRIRSSILGEGFVDEPLILDEETKERLKSLGYMQ